MLRLSLACALGLMITEIATGVDPPSPQTIVELELAASHAMLRAEVARDVAIFDLAKWKLEQLQSLRGRGHASWQEVALQQVAMNAAEAKVRATEQMLAYLLKLRPQVESLGADRDYEAIRLHLPGSVRLVGWIPASQASAELLRQQRAYLQTQHDALKQADLPSLDASIDRATRQVEAYSKAPLDPRQLPRAEAELRLAVARRDLAAASLAMADVLARRIRLLGGDNEHREPGEALARVGTPFVNATSHPELFRLTTQLVEQNVASTLPISILKQQRANLIRRIDALRVLARYPQADRGELDQAQERLAELEAMLQQQEGLQRVRHRIAALYSQRLRNDSTERPIACPSGLHASVLRGDANAVRYLLDLHRAELDVQATRAATLARQQYLEERLSRLQRIAATAQQPQETEIMQDHIRITQQEIELAETRLSALRVENRRFLCQLTAQSEKDFRLVQAADGGLLHRRQLAAAEAMLAAVGYLGQSSLPTGSDLAFSYLESALIPACARTLQIKSQYSTSRALDPAPVSLHSPFLSPHRGRRRQYQDSATSLRLSIDWVSNPCFRRYELSQLDSRHPSTQPNRFRSRLFSYSDNYAFGIRRLDGPSPSTIGRATAYGGPWYFPGSPPHVLKR